VSHRCLTPSSVYVAVSVAPLGIPAHSPLPPIWTHIFLGVKQEVIPGI
jgi:hypothetical protein